MLEVELKEISSDSASNSSDISSRSSDDTEIFSDLDDEQFYKNF